MATIHKTIPFINGSRIEVSSDTNNNPKWYTGDNPGALMQTEYSFDYNGIITRRIRTRNSGTDNWGSWGSWENATTKISNDSFKIKETDIDQNVNPTDNYWGQGYYIYDKNGFEDTNRIACFRAHTRANQLGLQVEAKRMINGTAKYNTLNMRVDNSGNAVVELNQAAWLSALGLASVTSTSTITDIISVNSSNATIVEAAYAQYGKIAQVRIIWTNKNALSVPASGNLTNVNIGTLVSGKRPKIISVGSSHGDYAGPAWYYFNTSGAIALSAVESTGAARTIAADTTFQFYATYILA